MDNCPTFREQGEVWLTGIQTRRRDPIKPSSAAQFRSHLNLLNKLIGDLPLSQITNKALREIVPKIEGSPKTVQCYVTTAKAVVASLLDDDGQPIYNMRGKWNSQFIDLPAIDKQKVPVFTSEQVQDIVSRANGHSLLFKTAAGSGLRIGELLALQPHHFTGQTLLVEQSLWQDKIQTPKTKNGFRQVDLCSSLAEELRGSIDSRDKEFIFNETRNYTLALSKLHEVLDALKIEHAGFHAFRRFRTTHLRKQQIQESLIQYWLGHAGKSITDRYDRIMVDTEFRIQQAEKAGLGF